MNIISKISKVLRLQMKWPVLPSKTLAYDSRVQHLISVLVYDKDSETFNIYNCRVLVPLE